jgi:TonB family protein
MIMERVIIELSQLGASSLYFFWLPLTIWTVLSLFVVIILRKLEQLHPAYHYHIRLALIAGLPVGLISWSLFNHYLTQASVNNVIPQQIFVLLSPVTVGSAMSTSGSINLADKDLWLGFLFMGLLITALTGLTRLFYNYIKLHRFKKTLTLQSLYKLPNLEIPIKKIVESIDNKVKVTLVDHPQIPFTFGWYSPVIVIPQFLVQEPEKMNLTLLHELTHIRRHDYLLHWFITMVRSLFLFHPLIHTLSKEIDEYNELSCDTEVMADEQISPKKYAYLLYELMHLPITHHVTGMSMANSSSNIKKRIQAMTEYKPKRRSAILQAGLFLVVMSGITMLMACSGLQNQDTSGKDLVGQNMTFNSPTIYVNGDQLMESVGGSKFQGQALGITYIETPKYGSFLISGQSFDGAKPVGNISGKKLTFKINGMNVTIRSSSNILTSKNARVWVKNDASISTKKSLHIGWAKNLETFHNLAMANNLHSPNYTMENGQKVYVVTDKMPELIGGLASIQSRVQYPELARKAGIEGRVYVQFVVDKKGNDVDPKVVKGIGGGCDQVALNAVKQARFNPGYKDGKPVQVKYAIPIVFKLNNE